MKPGQYHSKDVFSYRNGVNTASRGKSHLRMKKGMIEEIIRASRVELHPAQFGSLFRCRQGRSKPHVEDLGLSPQIVRNCFLVASRAVLEPQVRPLTAQPLQPPFLHRSRYEDNARCIVAISHRENSTFLFLYCSHDNTIKYYTSAASQLAQSGLRQVKVTNGRRDPIYRVPREV